MTKTCNFAWIASSAFASMLAPLLSTTASAQEAADRSTSFSNADIIVTARRVEERLQDVPISITVFNQQQISRSNIVNAEDLAKLTPSLSANTSFGSENSTFAIRGFVQDIGTAPSVGNYFADVVAPRGGSPSVPSGDGAGPGSFFDLQNVQVLKGPQGTLFGRNTTGGAVLLVPQRPTSALEGYVEGTLGNYDQRRVQAVVNIPLAESFRVRLGVDRQKRDGWLRNTSGIGPSRFNDIDYLAARASIVADLMPDLENYMIVSYTKSDTSGPLQKLIACNPGVALGDFACGQLADAEAKGEGFYTARSDVDGAKSRTETWQIINTTTWQASDELVVKNIASYAQLKQTLRSALFGTQFSTPAIPGFLPSVPFNFATVIPAPNANGLSNQSTFTEEFQLQGNSANGRLTWQAGVYYERSAPLGLTGSQSPNTINCTDIAQLQCTDILGFLANLDPNVTPLVVAGIISPIQAGSVNYTVGRLTTRSIGTYAQANYALTDQLKLTAGIRYTWDRQKSDSAQISYLFPTFPVPVGPPTASCTRGNTSLPDCALELSQKSSAPTWLIGLDFKPMEDLLLYAKYARGYRTGGIKSDAPVAFTVFRPEKVDAYEIGLKSSFRGPVRGNFNVSAFYNDFSDQQLQVGFADNPAVNGGVSATAGPVNAGRSRIYGVEVEAGLNPFDGLSLNASYAYLNTSIRSVDLPQLPPTDPYIVSSTVLPGDQLALAPKHKVVVAANYTLPLGEGVGDVSVGAIYSHTGKQRVNYAARDDASIAANGGRDIGVLAPIDLLNLNIDWRRIAGSPVDLSLFMTNVTKERYYTFTPGLFAVAGFEVANLGEPRTYGARLRYSF